MGGRGRCWAADRPWPAREADSGPGLEKKRRREGARGREAERWEQTWCVWHSPPFSPTTFSRSGARSPRARDAPWSLCAFARPHDARVDAARAGSDARRAEEKEKSHVTLATPYDATSTPVPTDHRNLATLGQADAATGECATRPGHGVFVLHLPFCGFGAIEGRVGNDGTMQKRRQ